MTWTRLLHPASRPTVKVKFQHRPTPHFPIIKIHLFRVAPSGSIQNSPLPASYRVSRLAHIRVFASRIPPDESNSANPRLPIKTSPPFAMKHSRDANRHHVYSKTINRVERVEESSDRRGKTSVCNKKAGS